MRTNIRVCHHLVSPAPLRLPQLRLLKHTPPLLHLPGALQAQLVQAKLQALLLHPHSVAHTQPGGSSAALELADEEQRRLEIKQGESEQECL